MKNEFPYLYPYSVQEAKKRSELDEWRKSFRENIACKESIEQAIREGFDGMYLQEDCAETVLAKHGYQRVEYVLANTLQEKSYDGRFSRSNRAWAEQKYIPQDKNHNYQFMVDSHPAVLDGFVDQYRSARQELGLFDMEHCAGDGDYTGKVLVMSPYTLKESYWAPEYQLWFAHGGFGCSPTAIGRSVSCTCLGDGEHTRWDRSDFIGVLDEKHLPEWAKEPLAKLRNEFLQQQEAAAARIAAMKGGDMEMK